MGMVLNCPRDALPGEAAAFLILDYELRSARSARRANGSSARRNPYRAGLLDLVTSPLGDDQLVRKASVAAQRPCDATVMPVRLVRPRGAARRGMMAARIATCGPPRAALLTVEPSEFGRR